MKTTVITISESEDDGPGIGIVGVTFPGGAQANRRYGHGERPLDIAAGFMGQLPAVPAAQPPTGPLDQLDSPRPDPSLGLDVDGLTAILTEKVGEAIKDAENDIVIRVASRVLRAVAKCASDSRMMTEDEHPALVSTVSFVSRLSEAADKLDGQAKRGGKGAVA